MTKSEMEHFTPTKEMIRAAENCFAAIAYTETIRPIVEGYQRKILKEMNAKRSIKWQERLPKEIHEITSPDETYLMNEEDFETYLTRCREEQEKAGLHTDSPEFCPLLVAEDLQRKAAHAVVDAMVPITTITRDMIWNAPNALENLKKVIDLTLRFLAPFCADHVEILKRLKAA
jgi:hypothetical protein